MNLRTAALVDPAAAKDPRAAAGKGAHGRGASDAEALPFPDVFDDLEVEMVQAVPFRSTPEAKSPAGGVTRAASVPDPNAFFEVLVASAASEPVSASSREDPAGKLEPGPAAGSVDGQGGATVDHLLKRVTKTLDEDPTAAAPPQPPPAALAVPVAVPPLVASAAPAASPAPAASEAKRATVGLEARPAAPQPPSLPKGAGPPRVSDVTVATQFAPIAESAGGLALGDAKAKPADDPAPLAAREVPGADPSPAATPAGLQTVARSSRAPVIRTSSGDARPLDAPATTEVRASADPADKDHARDPDAPRPTADATAPTEAASPQAGALPVLPATGAGSTRQIASALVHLASQAAAVPPAETPAPRGIARTLTLKMSPAELGTVAIKMHMSGKALDVQLTMSDPRTTGLVERERDTLTALITDKSYELHSLVIQDGRGVAQPGVHHASQGDTFGGQSQTSQRGDEQGSRSDGQPRREPSGQQAQRDPSGGARGRNRAAVPDPRRGAFVV